jgi:hypothetical protein
MVDSYSKVFEYVASCGGMVRSGVVDVFILRGKLWVHHREGKYSVTASHYWCRRWLESRRNRKKA